MSVDWGLEYLRGVFPGTGQSSQTQNQPEKPAVAVPRAPAVLTRGGATVPANNYQEVNTSEIQKSEIPKNPAQENQLRNHLPAEPVLEPPDNATIDLKELLDSIVAYLRKYLVCDDHQYTVLALWIVHTWTFRNFRSVAYLDIRSPEPQSGKTQCLLLLEALCNDPFLAGGIEPALMIMTMLINDKEMDRKQASSSFFFDDCHHTFASSERQRVVAMLNSGSRIPCLYMDRKKRYDPVNPKAFATSTRLPRSLAARCIPIILRRKKPSEIVASFMTQNFEDEIGNLRQAVENWVTTNKDLFEGAREKPPSLPPGFTARQADCAEPLVYIADLAGGPWPERARTASVALFEVADCSEGLQMLSDIRSIFHLRNNPEQLLTKDVLAELITHENRPWGGWHGKSGKKLGDILGPFGIFSRDIWDGKGNLKGYKLKSFQDAWERYLPPIEPDPTPEAAEHSSSR